MPSLFFLGVVEKKRRAQFALKGMTLVETIVAIGIFSFGIVAFSILIVRSFEANRFTLEEGEAARVAERGVGVAVEIIRGARQADNGAYMISSAADDDFVLYGNSDGDDAVERIHFFLGGGSFKMGVRNPDASIPPVYAAGDEAVSSLAESIVGTAPIFTYYDKDNAILSDPIAINDIRLVSVRLEVDTNPARLPSAVVIESVAMVRNLGEQNKN